MAGARRERSPVKIRPLTKGRWDDLVALFDRPGGCRNCWCMFWRLPGSEFDRKSAAAKRRALKALVAMGLRPGLLAYIGGEAVAGARSRRASSTCASSARRR